MTSTTEWRGKFDEGADLPIDESVPRRREARALLISLLRPYRWVVAVLAIVVVVENVARLSVPLLVQKGIDDGIPPLLKGEPAHTLLLVVAALCGVVVVQATSRMYFLRRSGRIGQKVLRELRRRVFRHFGRLDIAFHDRYTSGRVVSRSTNDVEAIQDMLETGFDSLITAVLTLVGTAVLLVVLDVKLGLMCLAAFPVLVFLVWWFHRESSKIYRDVREISALVIVQFVETMTGIKAVQAYRREPRNQEIFEDIADRYRVINEKTFKLLAVFMPGVKLVGNLTTGLVLLYGGYRALHGEMTIGTLAAFLLYLRMFFEPMQEISQFFNTFQSASSALEKLAGVLAEKPAISDPADPVALDDVRGEIAFRDVTFEYVPGRTVLPGLHVEVPAGQTVALVGTTGAGKTTIAKLLTRFYDPVSGAVSLDGVDLRDLTQADLRRHVVMVTQENFMFEGTVADNIRFGRPDATDEEVCAAATAVGANTFIDVLPDGYDTDVAKRGGRLSAGQRQLVAFARAFLADPAVLILDEATSSLDIPSERLVQRALETVLADRTAVVIAHRLSTVQIADRVLVLEHGRIVEDGPPDALIASGEGHYAALHRSWVQSLAQRSRSISLTRKQFRSVPFVSAPGCPVRRQIHVVTTVAVLGGGVGGLSAAHELAERGFDVTVYEARDVYGGKARSIPVPGSGAGGNLDLPAEHGFRFFPGFYRHVTDTMKRIPHNGATVYHHLTPCSEILMAQADGRNEIIAPTGIPTSWRELAAGLRAMRAIVLEAGIPLHELAVFWSGCWS